jgi:hypothetical protein
MHQYRHGAQLHWAQPPADLTTCQQSVTHANRKYLQLQQRASEEKYARLVADRNVHAFDCHALTWAQDLIKKTNNHAAGLVFS